MIDLTVDSINEYITSRSSTVPPWVAKSVQVVRCEEVKEETYVNYIFRVDLKVGGKSFSVYLRQTRDHLKSSPQRKLDPNRIQFEARIHNLLNGIMKGVVPEVLYLDKENNVAVLSDVKTGCPLLVTELLRGRPHPETGTYFGKVLAEFHSKTLGISNAKVHGSLKKNIAAVNFHLGMRMDPALKMFPDLAEKLLLDSSRVKKCLVLGDLTSKNIFVEGKKIRFLDLERAFVGDPAFDLGYLFAHYLTEVKPENLRKSINFIDLFMKTYRKIMVIRIGGGNMTKMENRVTRFLGAMILFRFFGLYFVATIKRDTDFWKGAAKDLLADNSEASLPVLLASLLRLQDLVLQ